MSEYFWAQVNVCGMTHCKYFEVAPDETLQSVAEKYFGKCKIVDVEEVTREYAEKHARKILK